jgi:hypothetical protein
MSGVKQNDLLRFETFEDRVLFGSRYEDPSGNVWRVRLLGIREVVSAFADQPSFYLHAHPIDTEPEIPPFDMSYLYGQSEGKDYSPGSESQETALLNLADADLLIELVETALMPPYRLSFLLDPPLNPNGSWNTSFYAQGATTPYVTLYSQLPASLSLSQTPGYTLGSAHSGGVSVWNAWVTNRAGAQNYFTLSGHLTVG